jgi:hypothetical protein
MWHYAVLLHTVRKKKKLCVCVYICKRRECLFRLNTCYKSFCCLCLCFSSMNFHCDMLSIIQFKKLEYLRVSELDTALHFPVPSLTHSEFISEELCWWCILLEWLIGLAEWDRIALLCHTNLGDSPALHLTMKTYPVPKMCTSETTQKQNNRTIFIVSDMLYFSLTAYLHSLHISTFKP